MASEDCASQPFERLANRDFEEFIGDHNARQSCGVGFERSDAAAGDGQPILRHFLDKRGHFAFDSEIRRQDFTKCIMMLETWTYHNRAAPSPASQSFDHSYGRPIGIGASERNQKR